MEASVTITMTAEAAKDLRDLMALNRGDVRRNFDQVRYDLDEILGESHAKTVGKRWRVKPVLRSNGTVKYVDVQARAANQ